MRILTSVGGASRHTDAAQKESGGEVTRRPGAFPENHATSPGLLQNIAAIQGK
jgi:hypothetical protein